MDQKGSIKLSFFIRPSESWVLGLDPKVTGGMAHTFKKCNFFENRVWRHAVLAYNNCNENHRAVSSVFEGNHRKGGGIK